MDSADVYADGRAEEIIGRWLAGKYRRGELPLADTRVAENADEGMRIWNQRGQSGRTWQVLDQGKRAAHTGLPLR